MANYGMWDDVYTLQEIAEKLGVSYQTVLNRVKSGKLGIEVFVAPNGGFRGRAPMVVLASDFMDLVEANALHIPLSELHERKKEQGRKAEIVERINNLEGGIRDMLNYLVQMEEEVNRLKDLL